MNENNNLNKKTTNITNEINNLTKDINNLIETKNINDLTKNINNLINTKNPNEPSINNIEDLESTRKQIMDKTKKYFTLAIGLSIIVGIFIFGFFLLINGFNISESIYCTLPFVIYIFFPMFLLVLLLFFKDLYNFKANYKKIVVLKTFEKFFTNIEYTPQKGIEYETINNLNIINMGDRFYSEDYLFAKYKDISFELADVRITQSGNNITKSSTIFYGQWYIFDFNKNFKSDVQVCEAGFNEYKMNNDFQKIELEDVEFNNIFTVYSKEQFDAFYVLTPNVMEKIKELNNTIHGKFMLCFKDSKLYIGINNYRNLFEADVSKKIELEEQNKKVTEEISAIIKFVDVLDLDSELFRKEV